MNKITSESAYFDWFKSSSRKLLEFLYAQPSLVLSVLYLVMSLSGLLYLYVLGRGFGIEIIKYLELTDFLMTFIATPSIPLAQLIAITPTFIAFYFSFKFAQREKQNRRVITGWKSWLFTNRIFYKINPLVLILFSTLFLPPVLYSGLFAKDKVQSIISGQGERYTLDLVNPTMVNKQSVLEIKALTLIAETERFIFFYSSEQSQTLIVTRDNIAGMHIVSQNPDN
jgi:hypothetical protein